MGKQGPCYHCGVASTPLWRNGPPEKPVLCNACGSRWRTKGTLANYTPLHARIDPEEHEDHRGNRLKGVSGSKEEVVLKRKQTFEYEAMACEEASNRSSSGSAISNSESCVQFCGDFSDIAGWDSAVPSRKRTCFSRPKFSPVEKLTKDLHTIMHEQQSYCFSGSSEDDLLLEGGAPMVSGEIGHGTFLIRHPNLAPKDEESEASSLSVENKNYLGESYSYPLAATRKGAFPPASGSLLKEAARSEVKREKSSNEIKDLLGNRCSPLCYIDLNEVLNFEEFVRHLSNQEQQQLLKYLPLTDAGNLPESIEELFKSRQFKETLCSYQELIAEGVYDQSLAGVTVEDSDDLIRFTLYDLSKCKWVEHHNKIKKSTRSIGRELNTVISTNIYDAKKLHDNHGQKVSERRMIKNSCFDMMKGAPDSKKYIDGECSRFSPQKKFALATDSNTQSFDPLPFVEENCDQDLLLDVPSAVSFAQAELLNPRHKFCSKGNYY